VIIVNWLSESNAVPWYRCSKLTSAPVTSEVVGSIPGQTHSSCDREGDIHCKSPNTVNRANHVLVDAQLSIQYLNGKF
jgi:hypothetical protein